jgi:hypothetical protein
MSLRPLPRNAATDAIHRWEARTPANHLAGVLFSQKNNAESQQAADGKTEAPAGPKRMIDKRTRETPTDGRHADNYRG